MGVGWRECEGRRKGEALETTGMRGLLGRPGGSRGVLPSALGGSGNTLCASSRRP